MTAYAYLRKSSVRPGVRDVSHEVQEDAVRALAARHGDADGLVILSDWDKSGRLGADKRPGYAALLEAIASGRATAIYSYSLSRLGRSLPELSRLIADCEKRGIPVRLDRDSVDTSTASGRMTANILGSVAAFEADVAGERTRGAIAAKLARGERAGTTPFYGDREGEDPAAVLAAFDEAGSYSGAARLLNVRGIKPRGSKRGWWPSAVAVVVNRLRPDTRPTTKGVKAAGTDYILARLMRCPTCGTLLTGIRDRGGRVRYACKLGSVRPHPRVSVTEHLILPAIKAEVALLRKPWDAVRSDADDAAERAALERRRLRSIDLYEMEQIDRPELERRLAAHRERLVELDAKRLLSIIPEVDWAWPPKAVNRALRAIFRSIDLDPETFQPLPDGYDWRARHWRAA